MKFMDRFQNKHTLPPPKPLSSDIFPEPLMLPSNFEVVLWKSYIPVNGTIFVENQKLSNEDISQAKLIINIKCSDGNDIVETIEKGRQLMITSLNMESLVVHFEETDEEFCVVKYGISIHN